MCLVRYTDHEVSNEEGKDGHCSSEAFVQRSGPSGYKDDTDRAAANTSEEADRAGYVRVDYGFHFLPLK